MPTRPRIAARAVLAHPDAVAPAAAVDQEDRAGSRVRGKPEQDDERGERATAASSGPGYRRDNTIRNDDRSGSSWWPTAARSPYASSAPAASSGSRPLPLPPRTMPALSMPARRTRRSRSPSYLHSEEHIRAAKESGADAIHPGYGFLAENADFAEAVMAAGLTWIGPPPEALRLGGDKLAAKRIAAEAGVPVVPTGEPAALGYPAARQGGGGRRRPWHAGRARAGASWKRRSRPRRARQRRRSATAPSSASATSSGPATSRSRSSPTPTAPCSRSANATVPSSGATRRCSRSPRPPRSTRSCGRR